VTPSATYSYSPAYRKYQNEIKIVHFIGVEKPWLWDRVSLVDYNNQNKLEQIIGLIR
jgi:lipopolysaccharide biosynthesis glycosyltransferase